MHACQQVGHGSLHFMGRALIASCPVLVCPSALCARRQLLGSCWSLGLLRWGGGVGPRSLCVAETRETGPCNFLSVCLKGSGRPKSANGGARLGAWVRPGTGQSEAFEWSLLTAAARRGTGAWLAQHSRDHGVHGGLFRGLSTSCCAFAPPLRSMVVKLRSASSGGAFLGVQEPGATFIPFQPPPTAHWSSILQH